ncbi:nucleotidyltransferase domain-containing protein [Paenibacillus thalictri]|uniref:Nucleotidyl transferase AbiEii/AbiGii toxin family protein n=1 Tax=Paenibacillus thalictri TaxID=2527873 RepID=A0A4Q9DX04_9BACL|nr:hypothetical protein [Paenibacillus thalictri]TBL79761.1 hypothetical protein EYB31_09155 [Paenibacillus thalictri]
MTIPLHIHDAIIDITLRLKNVPANWLIGGSCGLLLQGVETGKAPRDLDMYADTEDASAIAAALAYTAEDKPQYSETEIYRSILSHYKYDDIVLELVGGFQIISSGSIYTVETGFLRSRLPVTVQLGDVSVPLMPLSHELIFNLLRGREDRYTAIAGAMRADMEQHREALQTLVKRNKLSPQLTLRIKELLGNGDWF